MSARLMHNYTRSAVALVLALGLLMPSGAHATTAVMVDRAQLVEMSDLMVRATVVGVSYRWNEDHSQILTLTRLSVTQYIKGTGPVELTLRQFGGDVDGLVSRIPGEAYLNAGQNVVLSLRRGAGTVVYLTAMSQSVWYIDTTPNVSLPTVHRDMSGLTLARMRAGRVEVIEHPQADAPETLQHLVTELSTLARGPRR